MYQKFSADALRECYWRAAEARRIANSALDPVTKSDFLELEQRWLFLARSFQSDLHVDEEPSIPDQ
jgi:hypothetical protein